MHEHFMHMLPAFMNHSFKEVALHELLSTKLAPCKMWICKDFTTWSLHLQALMDFAIWSIHVHKFVLRSVHHDLHVHARTITVAYQPSLFLVSRWFTIKDYPIAASTLIHDLVIENKSLWITYITYENNKVASIIAEIKWIMIFYKYALIHC